jgi:hypothetical protein
MPGGPVNLPAGDALAALIDRRAELQVIAQAGRAAEAELAALNVEIDKADDALEAHPLMVATLQAIADHHLSDADAHAVIRAQKAALFGLLLTQRRDQAVRTARPKILRTPE